MLNLMTVSGYRLTKAILWFLDSAEYSREAEYGDLMVA